MPYTQNLVLRVKSRNRLYSKKPAARQVFAKFVVIFTFENYVVTGKINVYEEDSDERYKALPPEIRDKFSDALNKDEANFIKPLCITLMFAGLRIGEALALKWKNIDFEKSYDRMQKEK